MKYILNSCIKLVFSFIIRFRYVTHLIVALLYFRKWKTDSSRQNLHRCSGFKLQAKSQRSCDFLRNVFSVNIFIFSNGNRGWRNLIIGVLRCIFYVNISNVIGTQHFTSLPQNVVDRVQGFRGLWMAVVAVAVIPVSRSLVTGIQYQYIYLYTTHGVFCFIARIMWRGKKEK